MKIVSKVKIRKKYDRKLRPERTHSLIHSFTHSLTHTISNSPNLLMSSADWGWLLKISRTRVLSVSGNSGGTVKACDSQSVTSEWISTRVTFTHSLTHSLTHSFIHSFTHSFQRVNSNTHDSIPHTKHTHLPWRIWTILLLRLCRTYCSMRCDGKTRNSE